MKHTLTLLTALLLAPLAALHAAEFHVAPDGLDANLGTAAAPFATLERARQAVRGKIKEGLAKDIVVEIRGGTYPVTETLTFGPEDSGTEKFSITYAAAPGELVVLSGGRKIGGWKKGEGEIWTVVLPDVKAGRWYFRQLFVNGQRAVRARTPNASAGNAGWCRIKTSTAAKDKPPARDDTITFTVDHPIQAWENIADVELVFLVNNEGSRRRLGQANVAEQTLTLLPPQRSIPKNFESDWWRSIPTAGKPCYLENAREMLDEPGEWYLDQPTGVLAYWPRPGEDMAQVEVVAPVVQRSLLSVAGTPAQPVQNLHFQGVRVEHVEWPLPPAGYYGLFGCLIPTDGDRPVLRWMEAAVTLEHARSCRFVDGGIAHVGGMGLGLLTGTAQNVIEGNEIWDLGGGGICAGGLRSRSTLQWCPPPEAGHFQGYRIANNHVHNCGRDYFGGIGIFLGMTQDTLVAHNLIHDTAYAGIAVCGNQDRALPFARNVIVEYNHLHHVQKMAVDGGGIYGSFPHADRGIVIRGNLIHDITHNPVARGDIGGWSAPGIYLDGAPHGLGCKNYLLEGNVIYRVHTPLFLLGCREGEVTQRENTFVQTGTPSADVLEAIQSKAGLEAAYRRRLSSTDGRLKP